MRCYTAVAITSSPPLMTYIIGEIGINHNGSLETAFKLIDHASDAGCDAVKFQKRTIDIVYTKEYLESSRDSPWGATQRDQKEGLEFSIDQYGEIDRYCKSKSIDWFASSWDIPSQIEMRCFDFKFNKVASAMSTNIEFITEVASEGRHTFLSTGMMDLNMIDKAVAVFKKVNCPMTLLHTVSTYPAEESDLNLNCIKTLSDRYSVPVGYSGHEASVSPSIFAVMAGATVLERHITLNRAMYGSDQSASLEPSGLKQLVSTVRKIPVCMGDGVIRILPEEKTVAKKLRYWNEN